MKAVGLIVALALMLSGCRKGPSPDAAHPIPADHAARIEQWRAKPEADYREDYVTIAGLFPLKEGINTAGSAATNDIRLAGSVPASIGKFLLTAGDVRYEPARGVDVRIADEPVKAPVILIDDSSSEADELLVGYARLEDLRTRYPLRGIKGPVGTAQDMLDLLGGDADKLASLETRFPRPQDGGD